MLIPLVFLSTFAQDHPFKTGSDLYSECKSWVALKDQSRTLSEEEVYRAGECAGYMDGLGAGLMSMRLACPTLATIGTEIRVYLVYVDKHPKVLDIAASGGVYGALQEAYPCHTKK